MPKTIAEIREALSTKYDGLLKELDSYTYIPWPDAERAANDIFSPEGHSVDILKVWQESLPNNGEMGGASYGYACIVRVTVYPSDGPSFYRDGIGFSEVVYTKRGIPLIDPAIKGCASRGLVRALSLFGDAFGLFLSDKENAQAATGAAPRSQGSYSGGGDLGKRPTEGQANGLYKLGLTDADIAKIPFTTWKAMLDTLWAKDVPMSQRTVPIVQAQFAEALAAVGVTFGKQGGLLQRAS